MPSGSFAPGDHFDCADDFFDDCDDDHFSDTAAAAAAAVGDNGVGYDVEVDAATNYDETATDVDDDGHLHSRLQ